MPAQVEPESEQVDPVDPVEPPSSTPARGRVLVVDDSEINQLVAEGMLLHLGFEVSLADDGRAALDIAAAVRFDAVLMDVQMPRMDGLAATRELRRREQEADDGHRTPVIAVTAGTVDGDRERALEAGMDDYLTKPVAIADLDAALRRWLVGDPASQAR